MMTADDLMFLSTEEFHELVERDLRGEADENESAALRTAEVIERYYYTLVAMSKRVDATLGARRFEYLRDRQGVRGDFGKMRPLTEAERRELEQKYASQRSSTLRFKGGLDQHLADAKRLLNEHRGLQYEHLLKRIDTLETAVRRHKASMEADVNQIASDYDVELWRVLDG